MAINIAKKTALENPQKQVYVMGMIVHNKYVAESLAQYGVITLDKSKEMKQWLDELEPAIIIFSAHGISEKIKDYAQNKGWEVIDASCVDVIKTQDLIKEQLKENKEIFYVGKKGHPEANAVLSISDHIHLISNSDEINNLANYEKIFVTNQTTMSIFDVAKIFNKIKEIFPQAEFAQEICDATTMRQQAILDLKNCDLLYVVGDPHSNNSQQLARIALENGIKSAKLIETANDINEEDLKEKEVIYVTSGASTPTYLSRQVLEILNNYANTGILNKCEIELKKII